MDERATLKRLLIFANIIAFVIVAFCIYNSIGSEYFSLYGFFGKTIIILITGILMVAASFVVYRLKFKTRVPAPTNTILPKVQDQTRKILFK